MDLEFESVKLPDYYIEVLNMDIMSRDKAYKNYLLLTESSKILDQMIKRYFYNDESGSKSLKSVLNNLGGLGLRDKLGSIFIENALTGKSPLTPSHQFVSEILLFEDQFKDLTVSGVSRSFLLGFYLSMLHIQKGDDFSHRNYITPEILKILKYSKGRVVKIDWLLISIFHFNHFLGLDKCLKCFNKELSYNDLYLELTTDQQRSLNENYLYYGQSIGDFDIFTSEYIV